MALQAANLYANVSVAGAGQSVRDLNRVSGAVDATQRRLDVLGLHSQGIGKGIRQVAGGLVKVGTIAAIALTAAAVVSGKVATSFQQQMELIHTQAGATQAEVTSQTKNLMDLVHQVGTTPDELAKGLYHIESVGVRDAEALDVLKASALGAKMGLADMESVANALSAVSKSGSAIGGVKDMVSAMGTLNAIVGVGNMRMQDLAESFGTGILGTAKTFGIGLRELGAALAVLTDAGVPANVAATRLSMTFTHLAAPTAAALKIFKRLGVDQFEFARDLRKPDGIFVAMQDLHDHLAKLGEIDPLGRLTPQGTADVTKIFGGSRFGATAMQLLGQMDRIKLKYDQIGASQQTFGEKVQATMATAGFRFGRLRADVENAALAFGTGLLPALARVADKLDDLVMKHRGDFPRMGRELGEFIDRIDFDKIEKGLEHIADIARIVVDAFKKIPTDWLVAGGGLVAIDKMSGGLLGKGAGNIIGGGINAALNQFIGRGSPANPMWVASAQGFGGGLPGKAGVGSSALAAAGLLGVVAASVSGDTAPGARDAGIGTNPSAYLADLQKMLAQGRGNEKVSNNETVAQAIARLQGTMASSVTNMATSAGRANAELYRGALQLSSGASALARASAGTSRLSKALTGDLKSTLAGIAARGAARYGGTRSRSQVMGTFERDMLRNERGILHSHQNATAKLADLKHLSQLANQAKDWGLARRLGADIKTLERKMGHHLDIVAARELATRNATHSVAFAIAHQPISVTIRPQPVNLRLNGQVLARELLHYTGSSRRQF
jgi:TP901 family phage tail tape measure protein